MMRPHAKLTPLLAICAAFTLLVGMHSAVSPLFEAPDEVWHYAYVRWIAQGNGLPPLDEDLSGAYQEAAQPPLYYLVAAGINTLFDDSDLPDRMWHNPGFGYQARGTTADNKNMLIHTEAEAFPWRGATLAVHMTRLTSWLFGLITVIATWALGNEIFQEAKLATTASALVAFHPQFVFISSVVSNDSATAALTTLGLWLGTRLLKRGLTRQRTLLAGIIAGLGILTKTSALPMLLVLPGCLYISSFRTTKPSSHATKIRTIAGHLFLFALSALATGGWWYAYNTARYGDPLGLSAHTQTLWGRTEPASVLELLTELPLLWRSFWGAYGWGHVIWPFSVYLWLTLLTLPLLAIALVHTSAAWRTWVRSGHRIVDIFRERTPASIWCLPITLNIMWGGGIIAALLIWMRSVEAPHGRLLFPAIGAGAVILALGIKRLYRQNSRLARNYRALLIYSLVLLTTLAPVTRILATFSPPTLRSPESIIATCDHPQDLVYGDNIALICLEPRPDRVAPGDTINIKACWTSRAPINHDFTIYLHLLGSDTQRYAERHTYPGLGTYPTTLWEPGRAFCETYELGIASWADTPVRSFIEIGLYDAESGARLPATTENGSEVAIPTAGHIDIVESLNRMPRGSETIGQDETLATFGTEPDRVIGLLDSSGPVKATRGTEIEVVLNWIAIEDLDEAYVAFVHIWRPGETTPLTQHDAQPRGGWYPTTAWRKGDQIADEHVLRIPATAEPGSYPLWVGLYHPEDGTRLGAYGSEGRYPHDLVPLGIIEIE